MYIKRIELSHFKSFGGTTEVPLLSGFTVVSGPNGSGKSNILDALLFALGLSGSKGMRAERLPDLVNQAQTSRNRSTVEAIVTVTFDLEQEALSPVETEAGEVAAPENPQESVANGNSEHNGHNGHEHNGQTRVQKEWRVTRKLRVTQQGTYTSNYYINDQPCSLTELHEQLHKFRVYPEGYNVVLQGDVTSIISMNPRERREIIDEMAGVAAFDRKITQAKVKLDAVKDREERFRIVERELTEQRDRLAQDRVKAEKYQQLRAELHDKSRWETVLVWRAQQRQAAQLQAALNEGDRQIAASTTQLDAVRVEAQQAAIVLEELNQRVKTLGEEEQIGLQSTLATQEAELRQIQRQEQELSTSSQETAAALGRTQREIQEQMQVLEQLAQEQRQIEQDLSRLQQARDQAQQSLEQSREAASAIASASEAWIQEQTALRHQIEQRLSAIEPQRTEQATLQERINQLHRKIHEQQTELDAIVQDLTDRQTQQQVAEQQHGDSISQVQTVVQRLTAAEQELQIQQETQTRLIHEQRDKQRQLDKLEAQAQAMQEAQGTGATRLILQTDLPGVCGLIAQLGRVDPQYQLALEIAAGARLGYLVVEDDGVASAGIQLLKQRRAGRATFLPLTKIRASQLSTIPLWQRPDGFIDYACNLIDCDDRYREVFAYVFGSTAVFTTLSAARSHMGQYRIVTLDGELLETSGAMTGGSISQNQSALHFGTVEAAESAEAIALRERLQEIERILDRSQQAIGRASAEVRTSTQALSEARQQHRDAQQQLEQLQQQIQSLTGRADQIRRQSTQNTQELAVAEDRLQSILRQLPQTERELQKLRQSLEALEQSQTHTEWQQAQAAIRVQEGMLNDRQVELRTAEQRLQDLKTQTQRSQAKIEQYQQRIQEYRSLQTTQLNQRSAFSQQQAELTRKAAEIRDSIAQLEHSLASEKQERDRAERRRQERLSAQQELEWQLQKLQEQQREKRQTLADLHTQLAAQQRELPDPLPDVPEDLGLEQLQQQVRSLQKRIQAMEPVNMLALEEYDRTQARLDELSQKLTTLEEERTELLLRIENFTTLRFRAFKEAFDAVNQNFQAIFAELSDGDGYLQLDDAQDPFAGGLNLVAHPKGKPVQRLASMSGGEKSLTALSFIFALQRYRPSPFYAFDEVDMFLDGANVERLSRMIRHQAQQAQFIVVSLRRPMIESADRTIGVTQARGAHTQVLGLNLRSPSVSSG